MNAPAWDPVHDGREAFRACLAAMCAPGRAVAGPPRAGLAADPALDAAAGLLLGLLDVGVGLAISGGGPTRTVGEALLRATGAAPAPVCDADFVLSSDAAGVAGEARAGSALRPQDGATIVYAGDWPPVARILQGPGLQAPAMQALGLPEGELALLMAAASSPPAGVDAFVVSSAGLTALPRSVLRASAR